MNKYILKLKQFLITESGGHVMLTWIFVLLLGISGVNIWIAFVAGVLFNVFFEIVLPSKADIKDVLYGGVGGALAVLSFFAANYLYPIIKPLF